MRAAWRAYLRRHSHGRGVVLVGHSQGTFMLRRLIAEEIDGRPRARRRLVSAILLGGNVLVRRGRDAGADFEHVRACRSPRQLRCVVAFSAFNETPPDEPLFGVPRRLLGVGPADLDGLEVLCTNPAALRGGRAPLHTLLPSRPFAPGTTIGAATELVGLPDLSVPGAWIEARGAYTGRCSDANGANVLRIAGRPVLNTVSGPAWGLHLVDANLALGDLVRLVRRQAARHGRAR